MTRKFLLGLVGAACVAVGSGNSAYAGGCSASRGNSGGQGGVFQQAPFNQPVQAIQPSSPIRVVVSPTKFATADGRPVTVKIVSTSFTKPEPIAKIPEPVIEKPIVIVPVDAIASVSDVLARR